MASALPRTYKAAVFNKANEKLAIEDVELKQPEQGHVLIKVLANGVCHSDALVQSGGMGNPFPMIPGHEMIGTVAAIGPGEKKWKFKMCDNETVNGVYRNGGYAEYCDLRSEAVVAVPSDLDPAAFCPFLCAGVTVFNSMRQQHISPGETVAVQGLGGLGHLAIQFASKMGYRTVALSSSGAKEKFARDLGATDYIDGSKEDHSEGLQRLGGASLIVATAPDPSILGKLVTGLGVLGKLLILAPCGEVSVDTIPMIAKGLSVTCWHSGHATDSEEAISFARLHGVKCMVERFPLEKANEAYEHMLNGKARFRAVITMESSIVERPGVMASHDFVIVPAHTPKPLPSDLRSELTSALLSNSAIPVIQSTLHQASQEAHWEGSIRERAKQIITQGQAAGWQEVVEMLVKESCKRPDNQSHVPGGLRSLRRDHSGSAGPTRSPNEATSVTFPEQAIRAGKKAIREALDPLIEMVEVVELACPHMIIVQDERVIVGDQFSLCLTAFGLILSPLTSAITVADITGTRYLSPLSGSAFTNLTGLVTAKGPNGLWIRSTQPDDDERTSESVYVFSRTVGANLAAGDIITLDGNVTEFRSSSAYLFLTEVTSPRNVRVVSKGNPVEPVVLGARTSAIIGEKDVSPPTEQYSGLDNGDVFGVPNNVSRVSQVNPELEPNTYGMDFFESLSGELVTIQGVTALGRQANRFGDQWVYGNWPVTGQNSRGGLTVTDRDSNPETIIVGSPLDGTRNPNTTKLGDSLTDITGIVQYNFGFYSILPLTAPSVKSSQSPALPPPSRIKSNGRCNKLTVADYNIENFTPGNSRIPLVVDHIATYLGAPSIVFVQEVQDNSGATNDGTVDANLTLSGLTQALQERTGIPYLFVDVDPVNNADGGQPGGNIRNAYLFNPGEVRLYKPNPGSSTDANAVLPGPSLLFNPGRIDVPPAFRSSRKPLVAQWETVDGKGNFFTVNVHWTSKGGSSSLQGGPRPPVNGGIDERNAQANVTGSFIAQILAQDENAAVIAAGDFNEFSFVEPLERFVQISGLQELDVVSGVPEVERYTYTFGSSQQQLDHMYVSPSVARRVGKKDFEHVHVNTWAAEEEVASDHDPTVASLNVCTE
ncbi:MAG: hypothetical protein Q9173_003184 [Seirophora scorigena]